MLQEELKNRLALIEENIKKVNQEVQQGLANLNLLEGGRQECTYWLTRPEEVSLVLGEEVEQEFEVTETQLDVQEEDKKQNTF